VLADEEPLHTKEVKGIAGASRPGPQGPVGGHKGDQGRVGCLPSRDSQTGHRRVAGGGKRSLIIRLGCPPRRAARSAGFRGDGWILWEITRPCVETVNRSTTYELHCS